MTSKSAKSETAQRARKIVFVIFDQVKLLDIAGPLQVFSDARLADGGSAYDLVVASELGGAVATDSGMVLASQALSDVLDADVDTLLVAGGDPSVQLKATASLEACLYGVAPQDYRNGFGRGR
ncbi:DJ-1/PfpI family protein [Rhizobium pisi]|uniref:DJ-1/PfpI family protein n=1 Tax=Rhizobium pisi TaxID=574561 RepID=UPI0039AF43DF